MTCEVCKKRNRCEVICPYIENSLSKIVVAQRELPLNMESLIPILENHLEAKMAPYEDRHSQFLPELNRILGELPARQQAIIQMRFSEGLTVMQIARKVNVDHAAVSRRLKLAMKNLKRAAQNLCDLAPEEKNWALVKIRLTESM